MLSGHLIIIPDLRGYLFFRALRVVSGSRCPYSAESVDSVYVRLHLGLLCVEQITLFQAGELLYKHASGQLPSVFLIILHEYLKHIHIIYVRLVITDLFTRELTLVNTRLLALELGAVFHLTFDPRFLSISLKRGCGNT